MAEDEDSETIRARLLAAAKIPPASDSKSAKVREYLDVLLAYKKRFPKATYGDLLRLLNTAGIDVKMDTFRKVWKEATEAPSKVRSRKKSRKPNEALSKALTTILEPGFPAETTPPAENAPPAETEQITKPPPLSREWLTEEDMKDP